jgi:hypothetical protein
MLESFILMMMTLFVTFSSQNENSVPEYIPKSAYDYGLAWDSYVVHMANSFTFMSPLKNTSVTDGKHLVLSCFGHPYRPGPPPLHSVPWSGRLENNQ